MKHILKIGAATLLLSSCNTTPDSNVHHTSEATTQASHTPTEAEEISKKLFENEYLLVKRFDVPAGTSVPMHRGHSRVVYSLGEYTLDWTEEGRPSVQKRWSAGETHSHGAIAHGMTNIGDTTASYLIIKRFEKSLPMLAQGFVSDHKDVQRADHGHNSLIFENDQIRLVHVRLNPGESLPAHKGVLRAIYSLNDYELDWKEGHSSPNVQRWKTGDVHWHDLAQHSAKNTGDTVAEWLMIEPK